MSVLELDFGLLDLSCPIRRRGDVKLARRGAVKKRFCLELDFEVLRPGERHDASGRTEREGEGWFDRQRPAIAGSGGRDGRNLAGEPVKRIDDFAYEWGWGERE